jgi:hypothetical protein
MLGLAGRQLFVGENVSILAAPIGSREGQGMCIPAYAILNWIALSREIIRRDGFRFESHSIVSIRRGRLWHFVQHKPNDLRSLEIFATFIDF